MPYTWRDDWRLPGPGDIWHPPEPEEPVYDCRITRRREGGTHAVAWQDGDWCFIEGSDTWSRPIFAAGGKRVGKGSAPITDACKSVVTDGLTKAASMIGVGHEVFKDHVRVGQTRQGVPERAQRSRETKKESGTNGRTPRTTLRASGGLPATTIARASGAWLISTKIRWIVFR